MKAKENAKAPRARPPKASHAKTAVLIGLTLAVSILALYAPSASNGFVFFDDDVYVTANPHVRSGLSAVNVLWAFTTFHAGNWHPITWLSHMVDCQIFGLRPGWHHLVSALIHAVTSVLLFLVLLRTTSFPGRSALVAALFALHPLHVESVAWTAERKDVLSGLFWMLTLGAYAIYAERRTAQSYVAALALFALGLMAKPMLVTLPILLLLLDVWPLGRASGLLRAGAKAGAGAGRRSGVRSWTDAGGGDAAAATVLPLRQLLLEKVPFFALSAASAIVTLLAQHSGGSVRSLEEYSIPLRLATATVAWTQYLLLTIWPAGLAVIYPHPHEWGLWRVLASAALLAGLSAVCLRAWRTRPWLAVGWLWYILTLIPVIGLVQVGNQAWADRYTYIPLIGIFIAAVWTVGEFAERRSRERLVLAAFALAVLPACLIVSWLQVRYWKDSVALFQRAVNVTQNNAEAQYNLAFALMDLGDLPSAISHYEAALALAPTDPDILNNLGVALDRIGRTTEAIARYREAINADPAHARSYFNLGTLLQRSGDLPGAIGAFRESIRLDPASSEKRYNLGHALAASGRLQEAASEYSEAVRLAPGDADARNNLGNVLLNLGKPAEAVGQYREALRRDPSLASARVNLGLALSRQGDRAGAIEQLREAIRLEPGSAEARINLAGELAAAGRTREALTLLDEAEPLARSSGRSDLIAAIQKARGLYQGRAAAPGGAGPGPRE